MSFGSTWEVAEKVSWIVMCHLILMLDSSFDTTFMTLRSCEMSSKKRYVLSREGPVIIYRVGSVCGESAF